MTLRTKRTLQAALGILVGAFFLVLALWKVDPYQLLENLTNVDLTYLVPIAVLYAAFFWIKAVRWSWFLRPIRPLTARNVFPALMIGFSGNNVLPAHLGEFVRMYVLAKQYGLRKTVVLSTIVLERILDFLSIIALFALSLQFIPATDDGNIAAVRTAGYVIGAVSLVVFALFMVYVWRTDWALRVTERLLSAAPARLRGRVLEMMRMGVQGLASLRNPSLLAGAVVLTVVHWAINGCCLYLVAISFPLETSLPLVAGLFLMGIMALGVTLPSTPGYVGITQFCFVLALGVFGVSREAALAASFYALFMSYVPVTLVGFFFLTRLGLSLRTISQEVESMEG